MHKDKKIKKLSRVKSLYFVSLLLLHCKWDFYSNQSHTNDMHFTKAITYLIFLLSAFLSNPKNQINFNDLTSSNKALLIILLEKQLNNAFFNRIKHTTMYEEYHRSIGKKNNELFIRSHTTKTEHTVFRTYLCLSKNKKKPTLEAQRNDDRVKKRNSVFFSFVKSKAK